MVQKSGDHQVIMVSIPILYKVLYIQTVAFFQAFLNHQKYQYVSVRVMVEKVAKYQGVYDDLFLVPLIGGIGDI